MLNYDADTAIDTVVRLACARAAPGLAKEPPLLLLNLQAPLFPMGTSFFFFSIPGPVKNSFKLNSDAFFHLRRAAVTQQPLQYSCSI